jgi:broad specificity phosphatase PhoE
MSQTSKAITESQTMMIYIFRHAQKATNFSVDPDLTEQGHAQAETLLKKALNGDLPAPTELWVSPRIRTHSTFRPLSQHYRVPMQTTDALSEQTAEESLSAFRQRVLAFLEDHSRKKDQVVFLCSHYDWVLEAMAVIPSDTDLTESEFSHWSPCQYVGFEVTSDGVFKFIELKRIPL